MLQLVLTLFSFILPPSSNIVFFSGGNSFMPTTIYTNFLDKLSDVADVKPISNKLRYNEEDNIVNQLLENHITLDNTCAVSHSSGAATLLNQCSRFNVKKCVLLDPVDNNDLFNKNRPNFKNFGEFLIIKAENSYKWSFKNENGFLPNVKVPFIPFGNLDTDKLTSKTVITIKDFGHCDILDRPYSDYMHETFAKGTSDRKKTNVYKKKVVELIELFMSGNLNDYTVNATLSEADIEYTIS